MGFFKDLLLPKNVNSKTLKVELLKIERDRKRKLQELRKVESKKNATLDHIKVARKNGNNIEVDYLWEELQQSKRDTAYLQREMKVLNLEGIALKRYTRGLERLEKNKDHERVKKLLDRVRTSDLDTKLASQQINEQEYLDELNLTLEEIGLEVEGLESEESDPVKRKFLEEIDAINQAETAGEYDLAFEKENSLRKETEEDLES
jgi:hypothetical protein